MRGARALGAAALALTVPSDLQAQQQDPSVDYPGPKQQQQQQPKDLVKTILENLTPRRVGPDWDRQADLVPVDAPGLRGQRFNLQTHTDLPGWNPTMRLHHAVPGATLVAEFPFKVGLRGINQLTLDCELVSAYVSRSPLVGSEAAPPTQLLAVTRHTFALAGPGAGRVRIGFKPAVIENPSWPKVAICRMEAAGVMDGVAWRTHERLDDRLDPNSTAPRVVLLELPSGQSAGSDVFIQPPIAMAFAFERGWLDP